MVVLEEAASLIKGNQVLSATLKLGTWSRRSKTRSIGLYSLFFVTQQPRGATKVSPEEMEALSS
jgi:hypothetical protein